MYDIVLLKVTRFKVKRFHSFERIRLIEYTTERIEARAEARKH